MTQRWETLKDQANTEFRKENYNSAIVLYSDAISVFFNFRTQSSS